MLFGNLEQYQMLWDLYDIWQISCARPVQPTPDIHALFIVGPLEQCTVQSIFIYPVGKFWPPPHFFKNKLPQLEAPP